MAKRDPRKDKLHIIIYARFSKEDQNQFSIDDQVALCKDWLDFNGLQAIEIVTESDEAISGEVLSRPGIDRVREMVRAGGCDLLITEEASRLFRDPAEPYKLAGECVDSDCRLICINDPVDTDQPGWERDLSRAADDHAASNEKTSFRVKRGALGRWRAGYAMSALVPGYKRRPIDPERHAETGRGPFRDEKNESWAPIIVGLYERVARGDPDWGIAAFLTASNFPRPCNANGREWTPKGFKSLVQNPAFKGLQQFRVTQNQKHYGSGKRRPVRSESDEIWTRPAPDLAFVSPELWQQANDAISKKDLARRHPKGRQSPLFRIPRDRRGPINGHFHCAVCRGRMIGQGRQAGGYRC
ncbi:hypothetical protein LCGC14_1807280, partial [marine sediment metagenome]